MKKKIAILLSAFLALVACSNEDTTFMEPKIENAPQSITFNLSASYNDGKATTRAVKTIWETNDVIFVFFSTQAAPKYLEMKYDGTNWVCTGKNSLALAENETGTMRAVYLPFGGAATVSADETSFTFSETYSTYYLTATLPFTVTGNTISGAFNMQIPDGYMQFFVDDASASSSTEIELREPHLTPQGIASVAADGTITHTTFAHGAPLKGYVYDKSNKTGSDAKGYLFSGILAADARNVSTDYYFTLVSGGWQGSYYSKAFTGKKLYTAANAGRAVKLPALTNWTAITDYLPIDLGCDVDGKRIYWSSRNLGATQSGLPTEDSDDARHATWGDYYAWGETSPYYKSNPHATTISWEKDKPGYCWNSYSFKNGYDDNNNHATFNKYTANRNNYATSGTADGLTELEPADDAVRVNLPGTLWRMPTTTEWVALGNCTKRTVDDTNHGRIVTSKIVGYTDRFIFLPAAGSMVEKHHDHDDVGIYYWSSSLLPSNPEGAYCISIYQTTTRFDATLSRYKGFPLRPVTE